MLTRRACTCQPSDARCNTRFSAHGVARDDGRRPPVRRRDTLEVSVRKRLDMLHELRPAEETMGPRNDKLRVGQRTHRGCDPVRTSFGRIARPVRRDAVISFLVSQQRSRRVLKCREGFDPANGPVANGEGSSDLHGLDEVFGEFPVMLNVRAGGKGKGLLRIRVHTNILSCDAWSPPGQAERRFADVRTSVGGHGPFRGLEAPLALGASVKRPLGFRKRHSDDRRHTWVGRGGHHGGPNGETCQRSGRRSRTALTTSRMAVMTASGCDRWIS